MSVGDARIGKRQSIKNFFKSLFNRCYILSHLMHELPISYRFSFLLLHRESVNAQVQIPATPEEPAANFESLPAELPKPPEVEILRKRHVIIGAGISGLACAKELYINGETDILVLDASDAVGGRVRTDLVNGFLLDRGFQVFIEAYPEAQALLDYDKLELKPFLPGALVRYDNDFHVVSDPFRRPQDLIPSLISPIGSLIDKIKVGLFSVLIRLKSLDEIFEEVDETTLKHLSITKGISESMVQRFFSPFYQGIFLSPLSFQSSRMFNFVFKMFTEGSASLPSNGMQEIPQQIASSLPASSLMLNTDMVSFTKGTVSAKRKGNPIDLQIECENIILAMDPEATAKALLGETVPPPYSNSISYNIPEGRGSICLYFSLPSPAPITSPILILNGENILTKLSNINDLRINNVCFPSNASPNYAPEGKSLASITVVGAANSMSNTELEALVKNELLEWWGPTTNSWEFLKMYRIPYAQPAQSVPYAIKGRSVSYSPNIYICGDHRGGATLNGAIASGRRAAQAVLTDRSSGILNKTNKSNDVVKLKDVPIEPKIENNEDEAKRELLQAQQAVAKSFLSLADSATNVP